MSYQADITVIGAGVIGLAVAAEVAGEDREVFVLEKNDTFGQEISSRHSGVIHSGIYYLEGSLKAKMCIAGNRILCELCKKQGIGYKRLGKLLVAADEEEAGELHALLERGRRNGAPGLRMLSKQDLEKVEPNISGVAAILSPSTGIIDSHELMKYFVGQAKGKGAQVVYQTKVIGIEKIADEYMVTVEDSTGNFSFNTRLLINCAGLYSDKVAGLAGIDTVGAGYQLHYCKGEYFSVGGGKNRMVKELIYPVPSPKLAGLGVHVTLDLDGRMRLGPSVEYVNSIDYAVDSQHKSFFYKAARRLLPFIEYDDLEPEMAGIRPKLQEPGGEIRDFIIREESDRGLPRFINLIGIESPGLTAAPAIAEHVGNMVKELLAK